MKNAIRKKRLLVRFSWIISNTIWIIIPTLSILIFAITRRDYNSQNWLYPYMALLIFGIFQGMLIGICQASILWFFKLSKTIILRLSVANVVGTILGLILPAVCIGFSAIYDDLLLLFLIWLFSLFSAGFLWGLTAGSYRREKVDWAISNGFAYSFWGTAHFIAALAYDSPIAFSHPRDYFFVLIVVTLFYGIGFGLNISTVMNLIYRR